MSFARFNVGIFLGVVGKKPNILPQLLRFTHPSIRPEPQLARGRSILGQRPTPRPFDVGTFVRSRPRGLDLSNPSKRHPSLTQRFRVRTGSSMISELGCRCVLQLPNHPTIHTGLLTMISNQLAGPWDPLLGPLSPQQTNHFGPTSLTCSDEGNAGSRSFSAVVPAAAGGVCQVLPASNSSTTHISLSLSLSPYV